MVLYYLVLLPMETFTTLTLRRVNKNFSRWRNPHENRHTFEKKESKKKIVQDKLRELVSSGPFNEGDKLPSERELAQMLDVSRNVLREAVISMVAEGSLEVRERQGTFIKSLDSFGMHDSLKACRCSRRISCHTN